MQVLNSKIESVKDNGDWRCPEVTLSLEKEIVHRPGAKAVLMYLEGGKLRWRGRTYPLGLRLDAWTAWWLFSGLAALSYTFFLDWDPVPAAIHTQFWPLYAILGIALLRTLWAIWTGNRSTPQPRTAGL